MNEGVEYMLGELVVDEDEDDGLLNIEELKFDAGTGRAFSFDPLEVGRLLPRLGESNGEGVIEEEANALDYLSAC